MIKFFPCVVYDESEGLQIMTFHMTESRHVVVAQSSEPVDYIRHVFENWAKELNIWGYRVDNSGRVEVFNKPRI